MASLVGQQLKDTYDSLLKTSDNDALGGTYKQITDGSGNGSNLYLGTGGNVGIGSAPTSLLQLEQSIVPRITLIKTGVLSWYLGNVLQGSDNNFTIGTDSGGNTNILSLDTSGNVGIGISPSKKLTVFGTGAGNATVQIEGEGGADPYINFLANNTQHWSLGVDDSDSDKFKLSEHSALGTNDYLVVDTSGNVGIGTGSPNSNHKAHIEAGSGNNTSLLVTTTDNADTAQVIIGHDEGLQGGLQLISDKTNSIAKIRVTNSSLFPLSFQVRGSDGTNERMRIDPSGNVGIGTTTTTTAKLTVADSNGAGLEIIPQTSNDRTTLLSYDRNASTYQTLDLDSSDIHFNIAGSEVARIDSSGNVGIGTTPANTLTILGSVNQLDIETSTTGVTLESIDRSDLSAQSDLSFYARNGEHIFFGAAYTERMRIDSSGNVLVGTTDNSPVGNNVSGGVGLFPNGSAQLSRDGGIALLLNRKTSDGIIADFRKDGTTVGSIECATNTNTDISVGSDNVRLLFFTSGSAIVPRASSNTTSDNAIDLGNSSNRFKDIYATNGTIQTSDINEKQDIEELNDAELRVAQKAKTLLRKYRWKSSVEEKGDDARIHFGIIAQDLEQAFTDEGLDAGRYGMFIKSTWTNEDGEEQTRLGVRYNQLLAFIISTI